MAENVTENCGVLLEPEQDLIGIGVASLRNTSHIQVRVSVYIQTFLAILLVAFAHHDRPVKSSFKNAIITFFAIAIALKFGDRKGGYSMEQNFVAATLVQCLCQTWAITYYKLKMENNCKVGSLLVVFGAFGTATWLFINKLYETRCNGDQQFTTNIGNILQHTYLAMFCLSMLVVNIGLAYVHIDRYTSRHHDKEIKLTLQVVKILWVLSWPVAIAACEVLLSTFQYRTADGEVHTPTSSEWGLGQVMAMVMLVSQMAEISTYLREPSHHNQTQTRLQYWWITEFRPRCNRILNRIT
jgi:hypothetical protein